MNLFFLIFFIDAAEQDRRSRNSRKQKKRGEEPWSSAPLRYLALLLLSGTETMETDSGAPANTAPGETLGLQTLPLFPPAPAWRGGRGGLVIPAQGSGDPGMAEGRGAGQTDVPQEQRLLSGQEFTPFIPPNLFQTRK